MLVEKEWEWKVLDIFNEHRYDSRHRVAHLVAKMIVKELRDGDNDRVHPSDRRDQEESPIR